MRKVSKEIKITFEYLEDGIVRESHHRRIEERDDYDENAVAIGAVFSAAVDDCSQHFRSTNIEKIIGSMLILTGVQRENDGAPDVGEFYSSLGCAIDSHGDLHLQILEDWRSKNDADADYEVPSIADCIFITKNDELLNPAVSP